MFSWRPIKMVPAQPDDVVTVRGLQDRRFDKAYASIQRRRKAEGRPPTFPPASTILHFQMLDANMRRLKRYKGVPVARLVGARRLKGWTRWMLTNYPYDLL